ncbi:hypothetical protein U6A24_11025 [Aquimarina gracilis]|uniref:Uncharacterized protein n=1 Tax=Aquimarina gracilis TaxID=874422 RepID=A0ABU5ZVX2_9FLAO|nr:hypothetical protein [Aquimarina gracilis]MEB3345997.1 hypothetical protein [Aquimarina gracilis]
MTAIIAYISKSTILKYAFGYSFFVSSATIIEQEFTNQDFFTRILHAIPSKIIVALGIVYGVVIVAKKISDAWKGHQINRLEVKQKREEVEQVEIDTEIKKKEL